MSVIIDDNNVDVRGEWRMATPPSWGSSFRVTLSASNSIKDRGVFAEPCRSWCLGSIAKKKLGADVAATDAPSDRDGGKSASELRARTAARKATLPTSARPLSKFSCISRCCC